MRARVLFVLGFASLASATLLVSQEREGRVLDAKLHHLGDTRTSDWPEVAPDPEGTRLELSFESRSNAREWTLFLRQRSVDNVWRVKVNGTEVARLVPRAELVERGYALPPQCLKEGTNSIAFEPDVPSDDIVVGELRLVERSLRELYHLRPVHVRVVDTATGGPVPARVTVVDAQGKPAPLFYGDAPGNAARDGVFYAGRGEGQFEVPAGSYACFATRGAEWSLSERALTVGDEREAEVVHTLRREVDTTGFIACDTHLHTLQFSGHGDASALERQATLAGEGVEFAVATDHNHNTDYLPFQRSAGLTTYYTAVTGNEVTTEVGHFNGFPLDPTAEVPAHDLKDFVQIVDGMRAKGAKVVILNHPRWPNHDDGPFGAHHLDHLLGRFDPPLVLTMDATEMVNSTTDEKEPKLLFADWFALLDRGQRIFAVGSSDSHTVGDPVGQGRTYVPSASDDPTKIDVAATCDAIKNGHSSLGLGLFATLVVGGSARMGDSLDRSFDRDPIAVDLRVQAPSWIRPRTATLYVNGIAESEEAISAESGRPTDARAHFDLPLRFKNDAWIVCVVFGDAVRTPAWPNLNPYTVAATNPVFVDRDGGGYTSPRDCALAAVNDARASDESLRARCAEVDAACAVHLLDAWAEHLRASGVDSAQIVRRLTDIAGPRARANDWIAELLARR